MVMGGSQSIHSLNEEAITGDLSAILMQNMPIIGEIYRVPKLEVALMDDWGEKLDMLIETTLPEDLTNVSGVPSWTLVFFQRVLERTGMMDITEVWPNLELFVHGGVSFTPYREAFKNVNPSGSMAFQEVYNASEGFIAIQDQPGREDMLLLLDNGIFYEFMPFSSDSEADIVPLAEVQKGEIYSVIISTNGGLWRYQLGDTIEFTDLDPYRIKIAGRTKHFINVFGEELMVANTDKAISDICQKHDCTVRDYTVGPIFMDGEKSGGHEWMIEFVFPPNNLEAFVKDLDQRLQELNSDYAAKRSYDLAIGFPVVRVLQKGTIDAWLKSKGKLGGQHKVPRLSNERKYLEELSKWLS
jgi:hypothetical protein